jgi:glyoxylase-like metal-dependent hydrolase (beta-lactamase superfamily II)
MRVITDVYWYPASKPIKTLLGRGSSINLFAIDQGDEIWIIDAGTRPLGRPARTLKYMKKDGLDPSKLSKVLVTHAHSDHVGAIDFFKALGAEISIHEDDAEFLARGYEYFWEIQKAAAGADAKHLLPGPIGLIMPFVTYALGRCATFKADRLLHDGDAIHGSRYDIHVVHTPGHTKGSTCYYLPDSKALFSGDLVGLNVKNAMEKPPLNAATSDFDAFKASLERVQQLDIEFLLGAHAKKIWEGQDVVQAVWAKALEALADVKTSVLKRLQARGPLDLGQLKGAVGKPMWGPLDAPTAVFSALKSLEKEGIVRRDAGKFVLCG